jgi:hypothetical protein
MKAQRQRPPRRPDKRRDGRASRAVRPPHPGEAERIIERRTRALEMRKAGASYRRIASQLGVSVKTAHDDINAELLDLREQTQQDAQTVKDLELQRCDAMTQGLWTAVETGDPKAVMAAVRVSERRARLIGLDAPAKTELTGSLNVRSDKKEADGVARFATDEDLDRVVLLGRECKRIQAEIDAILEPARQLYLAAREAARH